MTRIILNCPVKKSCNINDHPGQPKEPGKPETNPKTALFPKTVYKVRVK